MAEVDRIPTARPVRGTVLVCHPHPGDPACARILAALHGLADTIVGSGDQPDDVDVIIADASRDGLDRLTTACAVRPFAVGILLADDPSVVDDPRSAAVTVVAKPVDRDRLRGVCALALECATLRRQVRWLQSENRDMRIAMGGRLANEPDADPDELEDYEGILTQSPAMREVLATLRKIEGSEITVVIQGETGTGKELVARAIHARSRRQRGPFVAVNMGALSDPLRESELFGHVRGAFTGASESRAGLFQEAHRGCIFLDEVADASPALQVALLRVLEEGTITPVGADRPRQVDVRVISATNQNLSRLVAAGRFRRDLYYRLNVLPIRLPPLRERRADVFPLANHFLRRAAVELGREPTGISHEARCALESYGWEGNIRELRNVMERAAVLCKGGLIVAADLPLGHGDDRARGAEPTIDLPPSGATLRDLEREIFRKTLYLADGNRSRAARILGLHESTFRFRLRKAGLVTRATGSSRVTNGS